MSRATEHNPAAVDVELVMSLYGYERIEDDQNGDYCFKNMQIEYAAYLTFNKSCTLKWINIFTIKRVYKI